MENQDEITLELTPLYYTDTYGQVYWRCPRTGQVRKVLPELTLLP